MRLTPLEQADDVGKSSDSLASGELGERHDVNPLRPTSTTVTPRCRRFLLLLDDWPFDASSRVTAPIPFGSSCNYLRG